MSLQPIIEEDDLLELLDEHPDGLTVKEVAEHFEVEYMAAQNALRQLHMDGKTDTTTPRSMFETKRWVTDEA